MVSAEAFDPELCRGTTSTLVIPASRPCSTCCFGQESATAIVACAVFLALCTIGWASVVRGWNLHLNLSLKLRRLARVLRRFLLSYGRTSGAGPRTSAVFGTAGGRCDFSCCMPRIGFFYCPG